MILERFFPKFLRRPPSADAGPLGLSPDQSKAVVALRETAGWRSYLVALETVFRMECEKLLAGQISHDEYQYRAGMVAALRRAASLPDDLARALNAQESHRDRTADPRNLLDSDYGFVGTPWYRSHAAARRVPVSE